MSYLWIEIFFYVACNSTSFWSFDFPLGIKKQVVIWFFKCFLPKHIMGNNHSHLTHTASEAIWGSVSRLKWRVQGLKRWPSDHWRTALPPGPKPPSLIACAVEWLVDWKKWFPSSLRGHNFAFFHCPLFFFFFLVFSHHTAIQSQEVNYPRTSLRWRN